MPRDVQKRSFAVFKTGFTALIALFFGFWRLFLKHSKLVLVYLRYRYKYTSENVHSPVLKLVLRYLLVYF